MLRRFTFLLADAYVLVVVWFMVGECGWVEIGSPLVRLAEMRKRDPISLLFRSRLTVWLFCVSLLKRVVALNMTVVSITFWTSSLAQSVFCSSMM